MSAELSPTGTPVDGKSNASVTDVEGVKPIAAASRPVWYRSVFFQITVLGFCSFLSPGIWGAMTATGGGGQQSVSLVNAANSSTFSLMVLTGMLTPMLIRLTNVRVALIIGTLGFAPNSAALYTHGKYGTEWFVIFGAVLCGISAGVFWATEGTVGIAYPERRKQGVYLSYWLMFRVLGQLLGGAINLGLNAKSNAEGSLSGDTYIVFVVLQCISPLVALLISLPQQVQRQDHTPVILEMKPTAWAEIKATVRALFHKRILLLLPLIWQTTFSEAILSTYIGNNFTVRSRALGSFLSAIVASLGNYVQGYYLDNRRLTMNFRAKTDFVAIYAMQLGWWAFAIVMMNRYDGKHKPIDWNDENFHSAFAVYILLQLGFNLMYELTYWLVGVSSDHTSEISRYASIVRAVESAGQAVSYGIKCVNPGTTITDTQLHQPAPRRHSGHQPGPLCCRDPTSLVCGP